MEAIRLSGDMYPAAARANLQYDLAVQDSLDSLAARDKAAQAHARDVRRSVRRRAGQRRREQSLEAAIDEELARRQQRRLVRAAEPRRIGRFRGAERGRLTVARRAAGAQARAPEARGTESFVFLAK